MNVDRQWSEQEACFAHANQVWLPSITTTASLLENEFDVHEKVSLAAVNLFSVFMRL